MEDIHMKKTFKIENLDCAHCAAKIEDAINKLDGVNKAEVNFLTLKLKLDAVDERFDEIFEEVLNIVNTVEPECEIIR